MLETIHYKDKNKEYDKCASCISEVLKQCLNDLNSMSQEEFDKLNEETRAKYINNEDYGNNDFEVLLPKNNDK